MKRHILPLIGLIAGALLAALFTEVRYAIAGAFAVGLGYVIGAFNERNFRHRALSNELHELFEQEENHG